MPFYIEKGFVPIQTGFISTRISDNANANIESLGSTYSINKMSEADRAAFIKPLKADQESREHNSLQIFCIPVYNIIKGMADFIVT